MTKKEIHKQEVLARKLQKAQIKFEKTETKRKLKEQELFNKQRIENDRFKKEMQDNYLLVKQLIDLINLNETNEYIISARLYNIRNAIFELTKIKKYHLNSFLKAQGSVQEHINGRQNLGIYILWCIVNGYIKDSNDLKEFYATYCVHIQTSSEFNNIIRRHQNTANGAILPETYISEYEKYYGIALSEEETKQFSSHFLASAYGKITNNDLIDYIRDHKEKILKIIA